jgi:hypothetical protein
MSGSDDLESRADDFEKRVKAAGSTEEIVGSLSRSVARNQKVTKWLTISLILDIVLSIALGFLGFVAVHNAESIKEQANIACEKSAQNSVAINSFLQLLIDNAKASTLLTPAEKAQRVTDYQAQMIEIPKC